MALSRRHFMAAGAAACTGALCGCAQSPATGRSFFAGMGGDINDDIKLGQQEHAKLVKSFGGVYEDRKLQSYVDSIGRKLAAHSEMPTLPYSFTIANSPIVNAFALPGGPVTVTRGLLALCNSEAELAGVLGHEIGHVTARHTAERQGQGMLAQLGVAALAIATGSNELASMASQGAQTMLQSYSRDQESEADALGARYLERTGYDVDKMVTFLDSLHSYSVVEGRMAGLPDGKVDDFNMMATHPRTVDRVRDAARLASGVRQVDPLVNREPYLNAINELLFGDDPKQGMVVGTRFAHPELRFEFTVPDGFRLTNGERSVRAQNPDGAVIVFDMAQTRAASMTSYLGREWAANAGLSGVEALTINGQEAATATTRGKAGNTLVDVRLLAIRKDDNEVFRLVFLTPPALTARLSEPFRRTTYSFRRLSTAEAAAVTPLRLVVTYVRPGETVDSLARSFPFDRWNRDWFRLLNQLQENDPVKAGQVVKMIMAREGARG